MSIPSKNYVLAPTYNGNTFVKDPETGLMHTGRDNGFNLVRKKKFLEIAPQYWPDITLTCDLVGISKTAYKAHYMYDPVFRAKIDAINEGITDKIEAAMAKYATQQGNFMDRIAWLRAHRGEKYNEKKIVQIQQLTKDKAEEKKLNLEGAIDAELVGESVPTTPELLPNQQGTK